MENDQTQTDRQNHAIVMRMQADEQMKASLFWDVLTVGVLIFHIIWLAVVFIVIATILLISSVGLEHKADELWPDPKDWESNGRD